MPPLLLLLYASSWTHAIFQAFRSLGPFGLLLLGALDSSFLFLPFGNDFLLVGLVSSNRQGWSWILYVVMSAIGSVIGVLIVDILMRKAGEEGLTKFVSKKRIDSLRTKIEKKAGWAVFTATLLPPPFPFTPVVMAASALQYSRQKLLVVVFFGRLLRFTIEALFALYFGRRVLKFLDSDIVDYFVYAFIVIAVIGSTLSIIKWLKSRGQTRVATSEM